TRRVEVRRARLNRRNFFDVEQRALPLPKGNSECDGRSATTTLSDIVVGVTFNPAGTTLAIGASDGTVQLWDPATRTDSTIGEPHPSPATRTAPMSRRREAD